MSLLDSLRQSLTFDASGYPSRRPRSPSLNHNVKQPAERRISRPISTITPLRNNSREAAWARVIGARSPCVKRKNRQKKRFFSGACGHSLARRPRSCVLPGPSPYIDARGRHATSGGKRQAASGASCCNAPIQARKQRVFGVSRRGRPAWRSGLAPSPAIRRRLHEPLNAFLRDP